LRFSFVFPSHGCNVIDKEDKELIMYNSLCYCFCFMLAAWANRAGGLWLFVALFWRYIYFV